MYIAITLRYNETNNKECFTISKYFKDIFEKLNITLIPIFQNTNIDKIVDICDGLILTGSAIHINPELYNEEKDKNVNYNFNYNLEDDLDYKLIELFNKKNKPILGICRGIQVINTFFGGSLNQYIPNHEGVTHKVKITDNKFLIKHYENNNIVNSTHTQAIKNVASGFKVIALSNDNCIEAIENNNILGIQWHPELLNDLDFFKEYINYYILKR